jgi:SAM-dependent methyltransferase
MAVDSVLSPFSSLAPADIDRLRARLIELEYKEETFHKILPSFMQGDPTLGGAFPVLQHLKTPDPGLATLIRLFVGELPVEEAACCTALGAALFETLLKADILHRSDSGISCPLALIAIKDVFIVADRARNNPPELVKHIVMAAGPSSVTLANATPRRHVRKALDIGCGGGVQSLQLAKHVDQVVGVDINERALSLGRFAAQLSGVANIEFRHSDFFSALEGEKFDLIVANPPFVISPESTSQYRDGGLGGDRVTETVIRKAGAFLEEGGISVTVCEWASLQGTSANERMQQWTEGNGCDVWISYGTPVEPSRYALTWLQGDQRRLSVVEYSQKYDRWVAHYEALGMQSMQTGLVAMRKRTGENWFYADEAPELMRGQWGSTLLMMFDLLDNIKNSSLDQLLDQPYKLAPQARLRHILAQEGTHWGQVTAELLLEEPLNYSGRVDHHIAKLCSRCDGTGTLRQLLIELAESVGLPFEKLLDAAMPVLMGLLTRGFLLPASIVPPVNGTAPTA